MNTELKAATQLHGFARRLVAEGLMEEQAAIDAGLDAGKNGKTLLAWLIKKNTVNPAFAKTSRKCPPFCIQPSALAPGVETIAELEMLDYLKRMSEGDDSIVSVCDTLDAGGALGQIAGLHLRDGGFTGPRDVVDDLDRLAPLDRDLLDWSAYKRIGGFKGVASKVCMANGLFDVPVFLEPGGGASVDVENGLMAQFGLGPLLEHGLKKVVEAEPFHPGIQGHGE